MRKNNQSVNEMPSENAATLDRRSYLKLAGVAGTGIGTGGGVSTLGTKFTTDARAATTTLDNFEDGDISEYSGHTSYFNVQTSTTLEGSYTLKGDGLYGELGHNNVTTPRGYEYRYRMQAGSSGAKPCMLVCVQDPNYPQNDCYQVFPDPSSGVIEVHLWENGNWQKDIISESFSFSVGTEYQIGLKLKSGSLQVVIYDSSGNTLHTTAEVSESTWSGGNLGFYIGGDTPGYFDDVRKIDLGGSDGGDGSTTSSPNGPDISGGGLVVDNFEDGDLNEYYFYRGEPGANVVSSSTYHGENALEISDNHTELFSVDGLANYPTAGTTFSCWLRGTNLPSSNGVCFVSYGVQDYQHRYHVQVDFVDDYLGLNVNTGDGGGYTILAGTSVSLSQDTWYRLAVTWRRNGEHDVKLYDDTGSQVASVTATDDTWLSGGIGFSSDRSDGGSIYFDCFNIEELDDSGAGVVVENFEDGDLSEYSFDGGSSGASIVSSPTFDGSTALEISGTNTEMYKATGLPNEPQAGDVFSFWVCATGGAGSTGVANVSYGVQDNDNRYYVQLDFEDNRLGLAKVENGSAGFLKGTGSVSYSEDVWYKVEIDWRTNGRHIVTLYTGDDQVQIEETDPTWTSGGIGYDAYLTEGGSVYFDYVTKNQYLPTDAGKVVDDFDDGDLSEYTVKRGSASTTTSPTYFGSNALQISDSDTELVSTSGLPQYPSAGDRFRYRVRATGGASTVELLYGVQDSNTDERYVISIDFVNDNIGLYYENGSKRTKIVEDSTSCILTEEEWFMAEVDWRTDGTQTVSLFNNSEDNLVRITGEDWVLSSGGIGYGASLPESGGIVYIDHILGEGLQNTITELENSHGTIQEVDINYLSESGDATAKIETVYTFDDGTEYSNTEIQTHDERGYVTDEESKFWKDDCLKRSNNRRYMINRMEVRSKNGGV